MSKTAVVETQTQPIGVKVAQSFNKFVTTIKVEMVVEPNMDVVRKGMVIGSATNLSRGSSGFLAKRNLRRSSGLLMVNIIIVGTPQMVFTNPIKTTHVKPLMSSIVIGG